ncbi:MAG: hypothetical protein LBU67_09490 [Oscillospiraceae bacterium]|nr:hypothetical protein [Oscillospiraceae bacterium]
MTRLNRLIGLPVICGGKKLGRVSATTLTQTGKKLAGLWVQHGLRSARWIPADTILVLGDVSILVCAHPGKQGAARVPRMGRVCDTGGMRLGCVTDVRLDERTLAVDALEITFGPLDDLLTGRRWVQSFTVHPVSGDVVVPCQQAGRGLSEERG